MEAAWYAANNPFKREPPRNTFLKRTVAAAVILGLVFVISGFMHADDTRGSAQLSPEFFAKTSGERRSHLRTASGNTVNDTAVPTGD